MWPIVYHHDNIIYTVSGCTLGAATHIFIPTAGITRSLQVPPNIFYNITKHVFVIFPLKVSPCKISNSRDGCWAGYVYMPPQPCMPFWVPFLLTNSDQTGDFPGNFYKSSNSTYSSKNSIHLSICPTRITTDVQQRNVQSVCLWDEMTIIIIMMMPCY